MTTDHPIYALSDDFVDRYAALRPLSATQAGVSGHDHELDDLSPAGTQTVVDLLDRTSTELDGMPEPGDDDDRLAVEVLRALIEDQRRWLDAGEHLLDVRHLGSMALYARDLMDAMDRSTPDGRADVRSRLAAQEAFLAGWRETLQVGLDRDLVQPARQVRSVIEQLRAGVAPGGTYARLADELAEADPDSADEVRAAFAVARDAANTTADWLEGEYLPRAPETDGVGRDRYAVHVRQHLGTDLDLDETYAWGWQRVRAIRERMLEVAAEIDPDLTLPEVFALLQTDPERSAPTQEAFKEAMLARQHKAIEQLDGTHVDLPDEIREVTVNLAPPGGPLGAWYIPPSEDLSRPGSIWWSIGDQEPVPLYEHVSTGYHEGFPGHHMQVGLAVTMRDRLSRVQRSLYWKPGSGEGWALYAERMMDELGFLDEPMYVLGYLATSMLRASRVVIDIGCHLGLSVPEDIEFFHPGEAWDFDLAVAALMELAFQGPDLSRSEATRYLGLPGQAISYAVGEQVILDLRAEVERRRGDAFDVKAFHAEVLGAGAVGLDLLREAVLR